MKKTTADAKTNATNNKNVNKNAIKDASKKAGGNTKENGKATSKRKRTTAKEREEFFNLVKEKMGDLPAVGLWGDHATVDTEDYIFNGRHFRIFPIKVQRVNEDTGKMYYKRTGFYAAFDMDRIKPNTVVNIEVPAGKGGLFCGSGAWQVAFMSRELGVKKVRVMSREQ